MDRSHLANSFEFLGNSRNGGNPVDESPSALLFRAMARSWRFAVFSMLLIPIDDVECARRTTNGANELRIGGERKF